MTILLRDSSKMLLFLDDKGKTVTDLSKESDITYCHVHKIVKILEERGIVSVEKKGRRLLISLTKKGKEIKEHVDALSAMVG